MGRGETAATTREIGDTLNADRCLEGLIRKAKDLLSETDDRLAVKDGVITTQLVGQCRSVQHKLARCLSSTATGDEELLEQGREMHGRLQSVLGKHDYAIASGNKQGRKDAGMHAPGGGLWGLFPFSGGGFLDSFPSSKRG
ncbi:hypothetical protein ACP4OV_014903 [Aristida adscensionis]